jgi:hypothetical protein
MRQCKYSGFGQFYAPGEEKDGERGMIVERDSERIMAFLKATVRFQNRNVTMDCIVRNISQTGARLEICEPVALPIEFELEIPARGAIVQCQLKWRNSAAVGVRFKDMDSPPTSLSKTLEKMRIEALEQENAKLRRQLSRLLETTH